MLVEAAVDTLESAVLAERAGAARIELCAGLCDGGLTPGTGLIATVVERVRVPVFVMIRPRGGGFVYAADELHVMLREIDAVRALGVSGIVCGALTAEGRIHVEQTRRLVDRAADLPVTFHRAFDFTRHLPESLEDAVLAGAARALTSGGQATALEGAERIASLQAQAAGRIGIVAGGGIRDHNVRDVIARTGVREVHARITSVTRGDAPGPPAALRLRKSLPHDETAWEEVDEAGMRRLIQQASA